MIDITDFSSLCINMGMVISAICTSDKPQPIFHQILMQFLALVNNPNWAKWSKSIGSMPLIYWYCYSFLEHIFNCFADFATNFGNGNIMSEACLITELNTKGLVSAIIVFKPFCTQIQLNQAQMTPIIIMSSSITAYTLRAWNNTQSCPAPKDGILATMKENLNATTPPPVQRHGDKHDPTTPESSNDTTCLGARRQRR